MYQGHEKKLIIDFEDHKENLNATTQCESATERG